MIEPEIEEAIKKEQYIKNKETKLWHIYSKTLIYFNYNRCKNIKTELAEISKEIIDFLIDFILNKQKYKIRVRKPELLKKDWKYIDDIKERKNLLRKIQYKIKLYFRHHLTKKLPDHAQILIKVNAKKIVEHLNKELEKCGEYKILKHENIKELS